MTRTLVSALMLTLLAAPTMALAQSHAGHHASQRDAALEDDAAGLEAAISRLEGNYGDILSDISCDAPTIPAHVLMCDSIDQPNSLLWRMGRLDDLAWAYAYENATKREIDQTNPPRDAEFVARRDACTNADCLHQLLIAHTNNSLGGESPYR